MSGYGTLLRRWRTTRGLSQLDLANEAGVSQRHLSFLETGRSAPSARMVAQLSTVLAVAPREQNLMLSAAGFAPAFAETPLDLLGQVEHMLDHVLAAHEPYVAVVLDRQWNVLRANGAAGRFAATLFPEPPDWLAPPLNMMRLALHRDGLRPHLSEWDLPAAAMLRRLRRDVAALPHDEALQSLLAEVLTYPQVAQLAPRAEEATAEDLLLRWTYRLDDVEVSLFTTIMTVGDGHDLTLSELRLETFWPADEVSARWWHTSFGGTDAPTDA